LEAALPGRQVLPNPNSLHIKEQIVHKAIGPLAAGRRQVNYLLSFQGSLELKDTRG
jgi:hypothetical protein